MLHLSRHAYLWRHLSHEHHRYTRNLIQTLMDIFGFWIQPDYKIEFHSLTDNDELSFELCVRMQNVNDTQMPIFHGQIYIVMLDIDGHPSLYQDQFVSSRRASVSWCTTYILITFVCILKCLKIQMLIRLERHLINSAALWSIYIPPQLMNMHTTNNRKYRREVCFS